MSNILLIITGSVAAYKSLDLIRLLKKAGHEVKVVMTEGAKEFVTPLSVTALAGSEVYRDLFSTTDEAKMSHIELARWPDQIIVAPASANFMAKVIDGKADDLASTILLATTSPIIMVPAMNWAMWENLATQRNVSMLSDRGINFIGPDAGEMACGEEGMGKMVDLNEIISSIKNDLAGVRVLITAGPTREAIDQVRFISNHSSGKQGYALAEAFKNRGADVTLVSGPVSLRAPQGVRLISVTSAEEMLNACLENMPQDVGVFTAAVADWRIQNPRLDKIKKNEGFPQLSFVENPDILKTVATLSADIRPKLVIGFAAETDEITANAKAKLESKACDFVVANDVSTGVFGSNMNQVCWLGSKVCEKWPKMTKAEVASKIADKIVENLKGLQNAHIDRKTGPREGLTTSSVRNRR